MSTAAELQKAFQDSLTDKQKQLLQTVHDTQVPFAAAKAAFNKSLTDEQRLADQSISITLKSEREVAKTLKAARDAVAHAKAKAAKASSEAHTAV